MAFGIDQKQHRSEWDVAQHMTAWADGHLVRSLPGQAPPRERDFIGTRPAPTERQQQPPPSMARYRILT